jgi:sugar phosphate isomerase/epimerase
MTALGRGRVDLPRILRALTRPVDWIIELDECATDPLDAAREGREYLESIATAATAPRSPAETPFDAAPQAGG